MCLKCIRVPWPRNRRRTTDLVPFAKRINDLAVRRTLVLIQGQAPFSNLVRGTHFDDTGFIVFKCGRCGREFQLNTDIYHGWYTWK